VAESQSNTSVDGSGDYAVSHVPYIKLMKLPPFHEEKEDLDAYLNGFERTCRAFNVPQGQWSFQVARCLQCQALDVYQRMSDDDVGEYDLLKNSLLKRFRLTERGYRKKFKSERIEVGETAEQFVDRLKKYLKWREMAGFEATYEGLQNIILRDQFFITCDKSLQIFLREKGKLSLKEMTQTANNYVEAHDYEMNRSETKQNKTSRFNDKAGQNPKANTFTCEYCNMNVHRAENCRKRETGYRSRRSDIICFKCGMQGHKQFWCPNINDNSFRDDRSMCSDGIAHVMNHKVMVK